MVWYHHSKKEIIELQDKDCKDVTSKTKLKPRGFWLSYNNDWEDWERNNENLDRYKFKYRITFKKSINVLKIDTLEDLYEFNEKYRIKDKLIKNILIIDWEKVCNDYDGIFFMNYEKIMKDEFISDTWFETLSVSSACIFRPSLVVSKIIQEQF
jgi:hypothetical protein